MSDRLTIDQRHNNMADCAYNQGVTLGEELLPLQGVWGTTCETSITYNNKIQSCRKKFIFRCKVFVSRSLINKFRRIWNQKSNSSTTF